EGLAQRHRQAKMARETLDLQEERRQEHVARLARIEADLRERGQPDDAIAWDPRNPYFVGSFHGYRIVTPTTRLAALAIGQSDLLPVTYKVAAASSLDLESAVDLRHPGRL